MKFILFTVETGYFPLTLKLCLNSMFPIEIRVTKIKFSAINIKCFVQVIFSLIFCSKGNRFRLKHKYNPYKYLLIK